MTLRARWGFGSAVLACGWSATASAGRPTDKPHATPPVQPAEDPESTPVGAPDPSEIPTSPPPLPPLDSATSPSLIAPSFAAPIVVPWPDRVPFRDGPATVQFDLRIGEDGRIEAATAIMGDEPFVSATRQVLLATTMLPASEQGIPVAVTVPFTLEIWPPPITIEGHVRLAGGTVATVPGARVSAGHVETVTDATGHFEIRGLPPGSYTLTVRGDAVRVDPLAFVAEPHSAIVTELWARPDAIGDGIVATYRRGRTEMARRSLTAEELRDTPGTLGDPLRAVVNLPGVVRSPLEMGWLLVRGGDPRDSAVYVDGVRVPLVYHLGGFTSVVHPAFVARVDFLPGGGGVRYGRATAGTVDLITRSREPAAEARVGANLVFASAYGNLPIPNRPDVTVSGSFRRSYLDAVASPFLPEESRGAIPRFWDWQGRVDLGPDTSLFTFGFVDTIDVGDNEGGVATISVATQRIHGRTRVPLGSRDLVIHPFLSWESTSFELAEWTSSSNRTQTGGGLRAELPDPGTERFGWTAGLDLETFSAGLDSGELVRNEAVVLPDVYGDVRYGDPAVVSAVLGLRVDSLFVGDQPQRLGLSPRLALQKPLGDRSGIGVEAGIFHQPPAWELVLGPPEGAVLELDESVNLSVDGRFGRGPIDLSGSVWYRALTRTTRMEFDGSLDQGEGMAYGADLFAEVRAGRGRGMAKYGFARSLRRDDVGDAYQPSAYDQPHTIALVAGYDLGKAWTASTRWRYATGFPVPRGGIEAFDVLTLQTHALNPESGRLDDFHALDLKISKRFMFRKWRLDAYLDVQNVYNRRVPEPVITGFTDVVFEGYGYGLTTLPIFGVEGQWGGDPRRP